MTAPVIPLGARVRDSITGFEGIAIGRAVYLYECPAVAVQAEELESGKPIDKQWFDEARLVVQEKPDSPCGF